MPFPHWQADFFQRSRNDPIASDGRLELSFHSAATRAHKYFASMGSVVACEICAEYCRYLSRILSLSDFVFRVALPVKSTLDDPLAVGKVFGGRYYELLSAQVSE